MKQFFLFVIALLAIGSAYAERGDTEDRSLMEYYSAHHTKPPPRDRKASPSGASAPPAQSAASRSASSPRRSTSSHESHELLRDTGPLVASQ